MNATEKRVNELKLVNEDHEWYPTTDAMIQVVASSIQLKHNSHHSKRSVDLLDIGAGDGRVLERVAELLAHKDHWQGLSVNQFAIEKAKPHLMNMPKKVVVIGTEFFEQSLVDKKMDCVFCNPPYSEYKQWVIRIIRECAAVNLYFIVPRRWRDDSEIMAEVEDSGAKVESLGEFDFDDGERQARAKVEIVRLEVCRRENETFNHAIEDMLPELELFDLDLESDEEKDKRAEAETVEREVAAGGSLIKSLVVAHDAKRDHLYDMYRAVVKINVKLMRELGVEKENILDGMRLKITALKREYWTTLFEHLKDITMRMATKQRKEFLESLKDKALIDFTESNVYSVMIWISKWASGHFDQQVIDLYKSIASCANVENYKSNQKVYGEGRWRYLNDDASHYKLGYRLVIEGQGTVNSSTYRFDAVNGLSNRAHEFLGDWVTVANNLGFECEDSSLNHEWKAGRKIEIHLKNGDLLMDVKAYKKGTMHIRVNQKVMLALNVQAGKLLGWLRTPQEAAKEMDITNPEEVKAVEKAFGEASCQIPADSLLRIGSSV